MISIVESVRKIVEAEIRKLHIAELGVVTLVYPHSSDSDKENYECNVQLKNRDVELRRVPVATSHIGLANIPHVKDLVLLTFVNGDINSPMIIGRLYNDEDRPPTTKMEEIVYKPSYSENSKLRRFQMRLPGGKVVMSVHDNRIRIKVGQSSISVTSDGNVEINVAGREWGEEGEEIPTLSGMHVHVDHVGIGSKTEDESKGGGFRGFSSGRAYILVRSPEESFIDIKDDGVTVKTDLDVSIQSAGGVAISAGGDFTVKAANIKMESKDATELKAGTDLHMVSGAATELTAGSDLDMMSLAATKLTASSTMDLKAMATANIEASGAMTVKGSVANIQSTGPMTIKGLPVAIN